MTYTGIAKGKIIEFAVDLPYADGQAVSVSIAPLEEQPQTGSPVAIRKVMHEPPHLKWSDVDEMEHAIAQGQLPVHQGSVFDE
ncbi:MAG TPA: hypothetical protein VK200_00355 [Candidatus Limnocylindrales bacterium]|nr:hypothetical protein [Candidatus Limnocylindrales bacterium]